MSTGTQPADNLHLVVGYDGSAPAGRALDAAVNLLQGRVGRIEVVYVAHIPNAGMVSATALGEIEVNFDDVERDLRTEVGQRLRGRTTDWEFVRRQGLVADELIAAARRIADARSGQTVAIVAGSSSHAMHRLVGSVAVSLARHSPVPLVIVP